MAFLCQAPAMIFAHFIHVFAVNGGVRPGKIDIFKNTQAFVGCGFGMPDAFDAVFVYDNDFSGVQLPD